MNIDDLVLFTETVVERLFDVFGEDFQLKNSYKNTPEFENYMVNLLRNNNIKLTFIKMTDQKQISGEYKSWANEIEIKLPRRGFNLQEVMSVIFHEFAHHIKETKVPGKFNPTRDKLGTYSFPIDPKFLDNPYGIFGLFLEKHNSALLMSNMLKYWTQTHERSNIAFTIAYDIYDNTKPFKRDMIDQLINYFQESWQTYHKTGDYKDFGKCITDLKFYPGTLVLLAIIFYRQELLSKRELSRELIINIPRTLELTKKYYRRVGGILNNSKNSQIRFNAK